MYFTVTSRAEQETAIDIVGHHAYVPPRRGSSMAGKEVIKEGSLQKVDTPFMCILRSCLEYHNIDMYVAAAGRPWLSLATTMVCGDTHQVVLLQE